MDTDLEIWCEENLPDLYDVAMFDYEPAQEDAWEGVNAALDALGDDDAEADLIEAAAAWFRHHHDLMLATLEPVPATIIQALCDKPQTAQHSADWYAQRQNMLTASEFSQILDGRRGALLRQKLVPAAVISGSTVGIAQENGDMNPTTWGHRFEPLVRAIFEQEIAGQGTVCDTLGRFTHQTIPWLSASPDGLIIKGPLAGRLVEIKAPKTRQPGIFVPDEYWIQMQIQMEVCNLDAVEFIEARFAQRPATDIPADIANAPWKGRIEVRGDIDTKYYVYSEPVEDLADAVLSPSADPVLESSVWWLTGWYPRTVLRDRQWWSTVGLPAANLFWSDVQAARSQPTTIQTTQGGWVGSKTSP